MPLTVNKVVRRENIGGTYLHIADMNLGVYATNGIDYTPLAAALGLGVGDISWIDAQSTLTHRFVPDYTAKKIRAYVIATEAEVANATDITAQVSRAEIIGS